MIEMAIVVMLIAVIALAGVRSMGHSVATVNCDVTSNGILNDQDYVWDGSKCAKVGLGLPGS